MSFGVNFLISNIYIIFFIGLLIGIKRLLKNYLTERIQYNLWFLLFALLLIPFLPIQLTGIYSLINVSMNKIFVSNEAGSSPIAISQDFNIEQINDFAVSVSLQAPTYLNNIILGIWIVGMIVMTVFVFRSWQRLRCIENSALPLQNEAVQEIYQCCLSETGIRKTIPIYSTAFLESPVTAGILRPRIYLPIHLISDFGSKDIRYMLLHELQHYRYKDAFVNHLMNLTGVVYWFNPFVWYALKEIRCDREVACDTSVLQMLEESEYVDYGNTLINCAEKITFIPFSFASGIGGNIKQIERRILNIVNYHQETFSRKVRSIIVYILISTIILGFAPALSSHAGDDFYTFEKNGKQITSLDLSSTFSDYAGSFVLYDTNSDTWSIYNEKNASTRVTPNSTYKIYDALLGLENGIITAEDSTMLWRGEEYSFNEWESDQDLTSAMQNSVNWYFQTIDSTVGFDTVKSFIHEIGYGNQTMSSDLEMYWNDLSLKISPIEQVELLQKFYHNEFYFSEENVQTVKNAIHLSNTDSGTLYGKTGTGRVDGKDVNGWFVGYVETSGNVYFFATNIQGESDTTGSKATEIALSVLSELKIWY